MNTKYLLDANVFIEAHKRYYAFDLVPSFWSFLIRCAEDNHLISIDRIKDELIKQEDVLNEWVCRDFRNWFKSTDDEDVIRNYERLMKWAFSQDQYLGYAKSEFANVADSWLIAYAMTYDSVIVTHEKYKQHKRNKILIPNVCREFGITSMNTFDMLRALNFKI
ncbi:DUF4411 family protein [Bacillaceae bacterium W0354]